MFPRKRLKIGQLAGLIVNRAESFARRPSADGATGAFGVSIYPILLWSFDADVLSDLGTAENLEAVKASVVQYLGGYGYRIRKAGGAEETIKAGLLEEHARDIDWVIGEFGSHASADLELENTIVFVDREGARKAERLTISELARRVKDVKPHFEEAYIAGKAAGLREKQMLRSIAPSMVHA